MKFYRCGHCGNIMTLLTSGGVPVICCGEKKRQMRAGSVEASLEKHIPVYSVEKQIVRVQIGDAPHPMEQEHWIEWIVLETNYGYSVRHLYPGNKPEAVFALVQGETVKGIYEYCNIHGLWSR